MTKILHITQYCHLGSTGGTERYVLDLVKGLESHGISNAIVWLQGDKGIEEQNCEGIRILPLPAPPMRVDTPVLGLEALVNDLLDNERPDWVHFHTFSLSEAVIGRLARERGISCAFTYHSPGWTCRRETLLKFGQEPCDGKVSAWRCSACQSQERLNSSKMAGYFAAATSCAVGWLGLADGTTSFRRRTAFFHDTRRFGATLRDFLFSCSVVVACADWSIPLLQLNGARKDSIVHCPQGVSESFLQLLASAKPDIKDDEIFTVGYVGRMTPVKGIHILMEGFIQTNYSHAQLRIVGWEPDNATTPYARRIRELAERDSRIVLVPKKNQLGTIEEYQRFDLLAIPSVWLETGPLTLMEAAASGVRVYGSNRIGQLGLLRRHGHVVESNSATGWSEALTSAFDDHTRGSKVDQLPWLGAIRNMSHVSIEHLAFYMAGEGVIMTLRT